MSTLTASVKRMTKILIEKKRRDLINKQVGVLRDLLLNSSIRKKSSFGEVLNRAALLLTGQDARSRITPAPATSTPGPIRSHKEVFKQREQRRRNLHVAGFKALQKYVIDNGLSLNTRLLRTDLLDIIIDEVKKRMSAPSAPAVVFPTPPVIPPAPIANYPVQAVPAPAVLLPSFLFNLQQLVLYQQYLNMFVNNEEYIDIINYRKTSIRRACPSIFQQLLPDALLLEAPFY